MNGIFAIYKEQNMTSHDVVARIKRQFKCKVGHTGTLDPNAEGVLVLLINQATKTLPYLDLRDKVYLATVQLGLATTTGDIWGDIKDQTAIPELKDEHIQAVLAAMVGPFIQKAPMVSAKKINGRKLYEYARKGQMVDIPETIQTLYSLEFLSYDASQHVLQFRASVSSGTYIRSLCEAIALKLGTLGAMASLVREQVGSFSLEDCVHLDEVSLENQLINPLEKISLERYDCSAILQQVYYGQRVILDTCADEVIMVKDHQAVAVYRREHDSVFKSIRGLW